MLDAITKQLLKFDVLNRFSGKVQFTAEIDCAADALTSVKLGLAVKWAIKSGTDLSGTDLSYTNLSGTDLRYTDLRYTNLRGTDLSGANLSYTNLSYTNLSGTDLRYTDLRYTNLRGTDLSGANLSYTNLRGTDLSGTDLSGADLSGQWIIQGATRSDGYAFFLQKLTADSEPMVKAGCRYFNLREAQAHWEKTRAGTALLTETRAIIRCMVDIAHARGLMVDGALPKPAK